MKMRKIISLALAIIMALSCFAALMVSADNGANVRYYGHQRTTAVGDTYGIRLIALVDDLSPEAVGFDIAIIHEDGSVGKYTKEVKSVYASIVGTVDGVRLRSRLILLAESTSARLLLVEFLRTRDISECFALFTAERARQR